VHQQQCLERGRQQLHGVLTDLTLTWTIPGFLSYRFMTVMMNDVNKSAWSLGFHSERIFSDIYVSVQPSGRLTTASTATTAATSVTCMAMATWRDTDLTLTCTRCWIFLTPIDSNDGNDELTMNSLCTCLNGE